MGTLYKRGRIWWAQYCVSGRVIRESTKQMTQEKARDFLKLREGSVAKGEPVTPRLDRIRFDEIAEDLRNHYKTTGARRLDDAEDRLHHLHRFFQGRRAVSITPTVITAYVAQRQGENTFLGRPTSNRTINIELSLLKRMLRLAYANGKLHRVPPIKMLKEGPPREGFFEEEAFRSVVKHLSDEVKPVATFAYITGWRVRSKILPLTWAQVDFRGGVVRLEPGAAGTTKTSGMIFPLFPELRALLEAQRAHTDKVQRERQAIVPWVFHRKGKPIKSFRKSWATACRKAGQPGRIPHDFRRSAARNMVRKGIPERVAMQLGGWKTRSVFERYNIVSERDLQEAGRKLTSTIFGTIGQVAVDKDHLKV